MKRLRWRAFHPLPLQLQILIFASANPSQGRLLFNMEAEHGPAVMAYHDGLPTIGRLCWQLSLKSCKITFP
jgi:hypothetical protein